MTTKMREFDNTQAESEGWSIFVCFGSENGQFQIQRIDEMEVFSSDDEAWELVVSKARSGSEYHRSALQYLRESNPIEWDSIAKLHDLSFMDATAAS
jgi:hypothetical protein